MKALDAISKRKSIDKFDKARKLCRTELTELLEYAQQAPSAFNIQHTRYIVIDDTESKALLKEISYGQQKVSDASAVIIILGDVQGINRLADISQRAVNEGIYGEGANEHIVQGAKRFYGNDAQAHREEAIRSASLATMNLMIAATAKGLATGPMIGFDAERLKKDFNIAERYIPVMLLTVGYAELGNWDKKPRLAVDEVSVYNAKGGVEHMLSK
ncbi:nitroreductase family protein [Pseudoalteromonas sp. P1-25]|uniref:nitroreductase family protein n=1 Tax=Pseudoalteromonas sp. P1-25 TaxID=1723758 RepID=UPI0006D68181|nr:nitroreductase family protein [Pseudoalteromonas sp. P1-25]KPZ56802.1 putative NAD(P)H nitroreductase MhqN [Pseudoalteromonas sp. P1-25]